MFRIGCRCTLRIAAEIGDSGAYIARRKIWKRSKAMTDFQSALVVFAIGGTVCTLVLRYSKFERAAHHVTERQKTWTESLQAGALLGAIFAVSYVGVLLGGWSRLWR
jgi:hypothetical protein